MIEQTPQRRFSSRKLIIYFMNWVVGVVALYFGIAKFHKFMMYIGAIAAIYKTSNVIEKHKGLHQHGETEIETQIENG